MTDAYNDIQVTVIAETGEKREYETYTDFRREGAKMNILEYIDYLMDQGYTEEQAETMSAYEFTDYHGED